MSTVAEHLRQTRETKNLTINQVAEVTKIRTDHVRALEEGDYNVFSAPVYIRGFVRTYANFLKLDVPQLLAVLDGELGGTTKFREPPPLTDQSKGVMDFLTLQLSKVNWRVAIVLLLVLGVAGFVYLGTRSSHKSSKSDPLSKLPPASYKPQPGGETLPLPAPRHP
ncbi:helix-turn-helix domain-containing protein [Pedosphaera parvula]|nr:helix-turn-helix domain-containing protein [Pedosphaera parvula]